MKASILFCVTIISLTLVACGHNTANQEFQSETAEISSAVFAGSEKSQADEKQLIERLQAMIELFDNVDEAIINVDSPNESEKTVEVSIVTELDNPLTDEQKTGVTNLIKDSFSDDLTITVDLNEKQHTD